MFTQALTYETLSGLSILFDLHKDTCSYWPRKPRNFKMLSKWQATFKQSH